MTQRPDEPWGPPPERGTPPPYSYGRASVPDAPPVRYPTAELPTLTPQAPGGKRAMPMVSWQRSGSAARRTLFDGWGFTAFGLLVAFCGWGIWAAGGGDAGEVPAFVGFLVVVAVGGIVFAVLRLSSRLVVERMLGRRRPHARWSHFLTGLFLTVAGVAYVVNTPWLVHGVAWIRDQWTQR